MQPRPIVPEDFDKLYDTFTSAFSSNEVRLKPTKEEFEYRIYKKLMMDSDISAGSFDGEIMLGFILHSSGIFQGIPTAYNGGTGVLPGFRNQKIAEVIYEHLIPKIQSKFLARILLEVVEVNKYAIKLYERIGFSFKRRLKCYKQIQQIDSVKEACEVVRGTSDDVDFNQSDFETSFLDNKINLKFGHEEMLIAKKDQQTIGHIIFQPHLGRISQLTVAKNERNQGIGRSLLHASQKASNKKLTIMNIPDNQYGMDTFLKRCGFENQFNQFEMELII